MRRSLTITCTALAVATVATSGFGVADAATGGSLVLGHNNHSKHTTTLSDSGGTPLSLKAPSGAPPLSVSNSKLVPRLNSQYLDGLTAGEVATHSAQVLAQFSDYGGAVYCPAGTHPVGGGVLPDPTGADDVPFVAVTMPDIDPDTLDYDGWQGVTADADGSYQGDGFVWVDCATGSVISGSQSAVAARAQQRLQQATLARTQRHEARLASAGGH